MTETLPNPATPEGQPAGRVFADHVVDYAQAGWPCILPVPPETKSPPPTGFTGAEGRDTDPLQLAAWLKSHATSSIALRMPMHETWCVIGIDVDQYVKDGKQKHGAETLAVREAEWGALPPTWSSTAREPEGPSRIRFFRAPAQRYATRLVAQHAGGRSTGDVEIIQRHHRYAVVWPSQHAGEQGTGGSIYRWYAPDGTPADRPPQPGELAELPGGWVIALAEGAAAAGAASADAEAGGSLLEQITTDWSPECAELTSARLLALDVVGRAEEGSRHDVMTERVHHVVHCAASGHAGGAHAVTELRNLWQVLTASEGRETEFERMLLTSARKAVTTYGEHRVPRDPCLHVPGFPGMPAAGFAPTHHQAGEDPDQDSELQILEPPRWASVREVIGAHAFDPNAGLDQSLAENVLGRVYPALRYAYDANAWLLRAPDRWEVQGRLSPWAVATVAPLMPVGDSTADKGSEQYARHQRRSRLMSTPGARAVAGKMDDLVAGGMHPAAVALGGLDADPEILWAGSMPYSLRRSLQGPAFADLDPSTPHIRTAGVTPELRATPLWDAFLAAVWPDPAIRAYAMRVLAIALTGYADRALPILIGETGHGKTQVVHLLMSVLGTYGHPANPKLLSAGSNEHDTIIYDLKGRRLSFIDEGPSERKAGQERLKQLTGGGDLTGRQMNQDPVTFTATHTFVLTANEPPVLTDPAVRSRARMLPCDGDPELVRSTRAAIGHVAGTAWRAEAPGVLALMMAEAAAWLADPTTASQAAAPESIRHLADHLGAEQDPIITWVNEETEPWPAGTPSRELYHAFRQSCLDSGVPRDMTPSETKWGTSMGRLGYPSQETRTGRRRPLRVRPHDFYTPSPSVDQPSTSTLHAPAAGQPPEVAAPPIGGGLGGSGGGLVEGSNANPPQAYPQVSPSESVECGGCGGSDNPLTHTCAPATRAGSPDQEKPLTLHAEAPRGEPKPKSERSKAATEKAAQARAEKRAAAIAEASGALVGLPAVVTRDGNVMRADLATADRLLATITGAGSALTVDVEHTGYPIGHRDYQLRTVQLGNEHLTVVLDPAEPAQADVVRRHMAAGTMLHAHSATADLIPLAVAGLLAPDDADVDQALEEAWGRMHDTVIPAKLADPASTGSDPGLKQISAAMLGESALSPRAEDARKALFKAGGWLMETKVTTPLDKSGWAQVDPACETMIRYAACDVLDDAAIATRLPAIPPDVLERERLAQRMTARVTYRGLRIDGEHVERMLIKHTAARAQHAERVRALTVGLGEAAIANPGSNTQVGKALEVLGAPLTRTRTGKVSVAESVLVPLQETEGIVGDLADAVLDYREHDTALGTFLEPYRQLVINGDGRARPTIYTLAADTGRMSCVRPNLQQVTRTGGFRACITADPGHLLASADFAGVELRVAAALSQDTGLIAILDDPERDIHMEIARLVWGPGATKAERYKAKPMVFGRLYGAGAAGLSRDNGVSEAVARSVIDAMDHLTPALSAWSKQVSNAVRAGHVQFPTYSGRIVHLDKSEPHKAPNYLIQGTARELLIDALVSWNETPWGTCTLLPVHDELVVHVPEDQAEAATAALVECMTSELLGVRIKAEASEPSFEWRDAS